MTPEEKRQLADLVQFKNEFTSGRKMKNEILKTLAFNLFISGRADLNGAGAAEFPIPEGFDKNLVFVQDANGVSAASGIISTDITPGYTKLYLAGQANHIVYYIVFKLSDNSTSIQ